MALYDSIGSSCSKTRRTDQRIFVRISAALEGCEWVLNVGSGTGSYEPKGHRVTSVEPSSLMMSQRSEPFEGLRAVAEFLSFPDGSFDAAMAVATVHHWTDKAQGLRNATGGKGPRSRVHVGFNEDFKVMAPLRLFSCRRGIRPEELTSFGHLQRRSWRAYSRHSNPCTLGLHGWVPGSLLAETK
ncbi:MAG: class I SAM-dependent methyltransferase [Nitrososphaerota archaeon]|nr:class I SAM-dependent methyltransferase [Nitrososphaerota archaeon]MDG6949483.1 class I SAM-dependent methyltransferase [Nitrososphaerota archaeon]